MSQATLTKLPNLAASFQKMKIGLDLEREASKGNSIIHLGLQAAFRNKRSINDVIAWVKIQAVDNADLMAETIGDELTCRILKFNEA